MAVGSKLFQLKEWLTLDDAIKQLSIEMKEHVSKADIFRLALDKKLTLSTYFPNCALAKLGRVVGGIDIRTKEFPDLDGCTHQKRVGGGVDIITDSSKPNKVFCMDMRIDEGGTNTTLSDMKFLQLRDAITKIEGVWDLAMLGGERLDIEHALLQEISNLGSTMVNIEGTFVRNGEVWASLQANFKGTKYDRDGKDCFYPAGGLDEFDYILVIRQSAFIDLMNLLSGSQVRAGRPAKLSAEQITEIKKLRKDSPNLSSAKIGERYSVSDSTIRQCWD